MLTLSNQLLGCGMRDDRYRGTTFPKQVRTLCRMAEREADRMHPVRLRDQAVAVLRSDADREISPEFRRVLQAVMPPPASSTRATLPILHEAYWSAASHDLSKLTEVPALPTPLLTRYAAEARAMAESIGTT